MTLSSMTGFGSGEATTLVENVTTRYACEVRSVNSRFLEVNCKMPRSLIALEPKIQAACKAALIRGKVDVFIDIASGQDTDRLPTLNDQAVRYYLDHVGRLTTLGKSSGISFNSTVDPVAFLKLDGVLAAGDKAERADVLSRHEGPILEALAKAIKSLSSARDKEGKELKSTLLEYVTVLATEKDAILGKSKIIMDSLTTAYQKRVNEMLEKLTVAGHQLAEDISKERILMEVAILAEKADIAEELDRLGVHLAEFRKTLDDGRDVGRKLDFLCQELHRETNTISSKLSQAEISEHSLAMKQAIERLRQQVQNIE